MKYDVNYFINKFEAIPEEKWTDSGRLFDGDKRCALAHCGVVGNRDGRNLGNYIHTEESNALMNFFENKYDIWNINDNSSIGGTSKQRILNYLKEKKEKS